MPTPINPYVVGNPVSGSSAFIGRADVLREVVGHLLRPPPAGNAVVLYGQRWIGKTCILQHLTAWLPRGFPYCAAYVSDVVGPLERVLPELARAIAQAQNLPAPDLSDPVTAFPEWLSGSLNKLPDGSSLVLLLDGLDSRADWEVEVAAAGLLPYLQSLIAREPARLKCVLAMGAATSDLTNVALSLLHGIVFRRVSSLSHEETVELMRLSERQGTLVWLYDAMERVWQLTHGHPFLTQQLCSHVWERAYRTLPSQVPAANAADVNAVAQAALEASQAALEQMWEGLPLVERLAASALAQAGPGALREEQVEQLWRESGAHVFVRAPRGVQYLQDWDWIKPVEGGYAFCVEMLRHWIAAHRPSSSVQQELACVHPSAEYLYRAARGLSGSAQADQVVGLLSQAVSLDPAHVKASQWLTDLWMEQGQAAQAKRILEQLYERKPEAARAQLVSLLMAEARAATDASQQLALYERVVGLEPAHPEATAQVAEIKQAARVRNLESRLQQLEGLEQQKQYQAALDLVQWLAEDYSDLRDWKPDLERLQRQADLADWYQRGVKALQNGDLRLAKTLLAKVVAVEPEYEEVTLYLHLVVTGVEPAQVQAQLDGMRQVRHQARRQEPATDAAHSTKTD